MSTPLVNGCTAAVSKTEAPLPWSAEVFALDGTRLGKTRACASEEAALKSARRIALARSPALTREQADALIPRTGIKWVCGRIHVGETDETVSAEFRARFSKCDPEYREAAVRFALRCHRENQALYNDVMGGNF